MKQMYWKDGVLFVENRHGNMVHYKSHALSVPDHPSSVEVAGMTLPLGDGSPGYATMQKLLQSHYGYRLVKYDAQKEPNND